MLCAMNERIRSLRIACGSSQVEFARLVGVTKQCVSNWENDNVLPSIDMLLKIADHFHVTTDFLLGRASITALSVEKLTREQIGHIALLISDFEKANSRK